MEDGKRIDTIETVDNMMQDEESSFNLRTVFTLVILNWPWFIISLVIFISGALIYLRYAEPTYRMSVKMLIKEENNNRRSSNQMLSNMQEFGFISNSAGIENEVEILKSRILALDAVKDLRLYTEYWAKGKVIKSLQYKSQPINVDLDPAHLEELNKSGANIKMVITRENKKYHFTINLSTGTSYTGSIATLPAAIKTELGTLTLTKNGGNTRQLPEGQSMFVNIYPPQLIASIYAASLSVEPTSKVTSIAQLTLNDINANRAYDYLKQLALCYNRQANADKNEIAYKTEEFINKRLEKINGELGATETELESYKRRNNLIQLRLDATQTLTQSSQYTAQLAQANTQMQLLDYLREYVDKPANRYQIIPSNVGLSDNVSAALINEYNSTVQERNRLQKSLSETAPQVLTMTDKLDRLQNSIHDALMQARHSADIQRQGIQEQYNLYQSKVTSSPEQERILTQIGRQQEVKSGLYLMLLQKREENSISLAATADKGKLIDDPVYGGQVSPKKSIIMLAAAVLGFGLPLLFFYLIQFFRYKIEGHEDVARMTSLPIVADVAVANEKTKTAAGIVVHENKNNQIDEIFRSMRTNIQFMMKEDQKVILFTSSTSGEGKTFNAANLSVSFALLGKKVLLAGLDIRKPALGRLFSVSDRNTGISTLLVKNEITEADVYSQICPSNVNANLDLLLAGPTPPNPTELLAREGLGTIIDILRKKYDYIILDTAPVGLVTDTLQIGKHTDVTVFVCRADYTPKSSFGLINSLAAEKKMPNMCVVVNGIDMSKKKYGYYYGYGKYGKYGRYGYGRYGYGGYGYGRYGYGHYGYGNHGTYGNYAESHYGNKEDDSIKR